MGVGKRFIIIELSFWNFVIQNLKELAKRYLINGCVEMDNIQRKWMKSHLTAKRRRKVGVSF